MQPLRTFAQRTAAPAMRATGARSFHASGAPAQIYDNILDTIGKTPIVKINNMDFANKDKGTQIFAKCEYFNPLSSVKDRLAYAIVEHGERTGALKPGQTIVEATSGNTGIALAMVCAQKGYPLVITMAESFSVERRKIMRAMGARVVLTPAAEKGSGMVKKAMELANEHGYYLARQFENEANPAFHANTTGPEILSDFAGQRLDYWVSGYGTGGTFQGAGKVLKVARPDIKIILSEPENAALLTSGVAQERTDTGSPASTHPSFTPHPIQGWTPDFIPKVTEDGMNLNLCDEILTITGDESIATAQRLAKEEGIFTGISGGASMATALKVAESAPAGSNIVTMLADTAERYMSTPLFASIMSDMNEEEVALSGSTPGFQLPPPAAN